jgi:hypothetical protein
VNLVPVILKEPPHIDRLQFVQVPHVFDLLHVTLAAAAAVCAALTRADRFLVYARNSGHR